MDGHPWESLPWTASLAKPRNSSLEGILLGPGQPIYRITRDYSGLVEINRDSPEFVEPSVIRSVFCMVLKARFFVTFSALDPFFNAKKHPKRGPGASPKRHKIDEKSNLS